MVQICFVNGIVKTAKIRPAAVIFTLCMFSLGLAAFVAAIFVSSPGLEIPNYDKRKEWRHFLRHVAENRYCLTNDTGGKSARIENNQIFINYPVDMHGNFSMVNGNTLSGFINTTGMPQTCSSGSAPGNIAFSITVPSGSPSRHEQKACLRLRVPAGIFPTFMQEPCHEYDGPAANAAVAVTLNVLEVRPDKAHKCPDAAAFAFNFDNYIDSYEISDVLSKVDREIIYTNLLWIIVACLIVIILVVCYSIITNKYCDY